MSLLYIIDGYNIINHTKFSPLTKKINPVRNNEALNKENKISNGVKDSRKALLEFIKTQKLCGSAKNKIAVVFDGYPNLSSQKLDEDEINVIFSKEETADARIKKMVETQGNPKNIAVVSDDREIKFFVKASGARSISVEEFIYSATTYRARINRKEKSHGRERDLLKPELSYSQIDKINRELKAIWLDNQ